MSPESAKRIKILRTNSYKHSTEVAPRESETSQTGGGGC
jgi:hypothetical protein